LLKSYDWQKRVLDIQKTLTEEMAKIKGLEGVADVRILGAIGVIEMNRQVNVAKIQSYFITRHNVNIRPFGRLIYIMPPFIISRDETIALTDAIYHSINGKQWE
jgi:adenosylmethionine-8-amino-7-oxononanoate aminotransferase